MDPGLPIAGIRSILFVHLVMISILMPDHELLLIRAMIRTWRSFHAPFQEKKENPGKKDSFWEIDMTKFEP